MPFITLTDYLLLPFYLLGIYAVAYRIRDTHYPPGHPWRPYFLSGLTVKVVGAIFIGLVYQYYYGSGDTANYFNHAKAINSAFKESPVKWLNLLFSIPPWYDAEYMMYTSQLPWYGIANIYTVCSLAAVVGIFTFNTFLPTSVLFAFISFSGVWALFRTFAHLYPKLVRPIAIATLFIPSTFVWGSGIFKDTICMFGLGWMTYGVFQMLIQRRFSWKVILATVVGFYLVFVVKVYILVSFVPAIGLWVLFNYTQRIRTSIVRTATKVIVVALATAGFLMVAQIFAQELGGYSLDNIVKTSTITRDWIAFSSGPEGSTYDLGTIDPTPQGMLAKFPAAVNVTFFRPYLWEARKPIVFLNALESLLFLILTLHILTRLGPRKVWKAISKDPNVQFCLLFALIFGFSVGISSYNFGALSRYKIPCLPMFGLALLLIYYRYKPPTGKLLGFI